MRPRVARRAGLPAVAPDMPRSRGRVLLLIFVIALYLPFSFYLGSVRMSPARLVILAGFLPLLGLLLAGRGGRIIATDVLVLLYAAWLGLTLVLLHGTERLQYAGITVVEAAAPYLLARIAVRSVADFITFARIFFIAVAILLPFSIAEVLTDQPYYINLFSFFEQYYNINKEQRLGLFRAQGAFEHPILNGVVCAAAFSTTLLAVVPRAPAMQRYVLAAVPGLSTFLSLSAGAFVSLIVQMAALTWDRATRAIPRRWTLLVMLGILFYIVIDLLSNRTPFHVVVDYMTFNTGNSYNRILIWHYGTRSVAEHPLLGIGLNEWERADFMSASMDNFWLVQAVRHGLPGFILIALAVFTVFRRLGRIPGLDPVAADCRKALLITLGGICFSICTVHIWNNSYILFMFLLGSGAWLIDHRPPASESAPDATPSRRRTVL